MNQDIVKLFLLEGEGIPLIGGQGDSTKFKNKVLKKVGDIKNQQFLSEVIDQIIPKNYRLSKPIKSINNNYIEGFYCVSEYEKGEHNFSDYRKFLNVSIDLHKDLNEIKIQKFPKFNDPWSISHRVLFNKESLPTTIKKEMKDIIESLLKKLKPLNLPHQLIHTDLAGNILFDDKLGPLVIDFSPAYAPVEYAISIMICDLITWHGIDISIIDNLLQAFSYETLRYAILFRILTAAQLHKENVEKFILEWEAYKPIWDYLLLKENNPINR